jgi:hypothetical protein
MNENECRGFEIAIEMRRHGSADPEPSQRLDEHLRGCAECRSYENLGAETEVGLRSDAEEARARVDLERLRARGHQSLGGIWSDFGAFCLLLSLAFMTRVAFGDGRIDPEMATLQAILLLAWPFVLLRRSRRELEEAWSSDTLFYAIRKELKQRLLLSGSLAVIAVTLMALMLVDRALGSGVFPGGAPRLAFSAALGTLGIFVLTVRVPRLLRERREIPLVPDPYQHSSESFFGLL